MGAAGTESMPARKAKLSAILPLLANSQGPGPGAKVSSSSSSSTGERARLRGVRGLVVVLGGDMAAMARVYCSTC